MLFNGADNSQKLTLPLKDRGPPSNSWFPGTTRVSPQTASRSVQPFLHGSRTHIQTNTQTDRLANAAMWPKTY